MAHIINVIETLIEKNSSYFCPFDMNIKYSHIYTNENVDNLIYLSKYLGKTKLFSKASNTKLVQNKPSDRFSQVIPK